ncbi:MAG TPA: small basic protein [Pirellulaceae bacterium]
MTIDKSLRVRKGLMKVRNVLTRPERIARLLDTERWKEGDAVLGIPKVRVIKLSMKKKKKEKKDEAADAAAPATKAPAGKAGAGAKAPAAKAPAPAAKPAAKPGGKK